MRNAEPLGSAAISQSSEMEVDGSIHEVLIRASNAVRRAENNHDEMSVNNLGILVRQVSEVPTREIENLIGELRELREQLQTDGSRIQHDIVEYAELSQGIMQLTTIISDSVQKLPGAPVASRYNIVATEPYVASQPERRRAVGRTT
jgi:hypothetical protein